MRSLAGIEILTPADDTSVVQIAKLCVEKPMLRYIRLDRKNLPEIYKGKNIFTNDGVNLISGGKGRALVASGYMLHTALEVQKKLAEQGKEFAVFDLFKIKKISSSFANLLKPFQKIYTLEEHFLSGGFGSAVLEYCEENNLAQKVKRIGVEDHYYFENGGRKYIHKLAKIDSDSIVERILKDSRDDV